MIKLIFKRPVFFVLRFFARRRISRIRPKIIGVTGSIGKTTTKEALFHVLSRQFRVLKTEKNLNTEFGICFSILEVQNPGYSILGWVRAFFLAFQKAFFVHDRYDFFVLEMAVDKPGDMDLILSVVKPDIGVFTGVFLAHMAEGQFRNLEDIYQEKVKLIEALAKNGIAFLNADNEFLSIHRPNTAAKVIWYGNHPDAKLKSLIPEMSFDGITFTAEYGEVRASFSVPMLGKHHVNALLPAIGCGLTNGMYFFDIVESLKNFHLPAGRLNLISGIRDSLIIDSSYNASPEAVKMALSVLKELGNSDSRGRFKKRKIFVFGNMNELGNFSEKAHLHIASAISDATDLLITVGDFARLTAEEVLRQNILPKNCVHSFSDVMTARDFVKGLLQPNDLVLVKGSQNRVRLEKLVKYIMAEPERASELLVRQGREWQDKELRTEDGALRK